VAQGLGFARVQERMGLRVRTGDRRQRRRKYAGGWGDAAESGSVRAAARRRQCKGAGATSAGMRGRQVTAAARKVCVCGGG
jgi:hypothetical protein